MPRRRRPPRVGAMTELPPLRILTQIVALQAAFYATATVLLCLAALTAGTAVGPDLVLGWEQVRGDTTHGWTLAFVWVLSGGFCMAVAIVLLVARSKLVTDFAVTMHAIHALVCTAYDGRLPRNTLWWATMALSTILAIMLGTWACQQRELRPIFFGAGVAASSSSNDPLSAAPLQRRATGKEEDDDDDEDEDGAIRFPVGRGRGRGRDGAGEYEMVKLVKE